jgi:hypothetical protein
MKPLIPIWLALLLVSVLTCWSAQNADIEIVRRVADYVLSHTEYKWEAPYNDFHATGTIIQAGLEVIKLKERLRKKTP